MRGVYLVTDRALSLGRPVEEIAAAAVRGGVSAVQIREKNLSKGAFTERAEGLMRLLAPRGIPLIVNDRVDVALAAGAGGVHLGQSDMPYREARRLLGPGAVVGVSVETMEQAEEVDGEYVDYLGVGPIFPTLSKTDTGALWGLEGLRAVRGVTALPLAAIGGINGGNAAEVFAAGADVAAVISAICSAEDPEGAARELVCIAAASKISSYKENVGGE